MSEQLLAIGGLNAYYGRAHILQGVGLEMGAEPVAVIGRNGMGKSTLCNAIMGMVPHINGSIRFEGDELVGKSSYKIANCGIGYVPQGRRLFQSLTVDEHLRMLGSEVGPWNRDAVYELFPRLAERKSSGALQLSGGEQQMLAIGRALMTNPRLLILDEATEGLAPLIRAEIYRAIQRLKAAGLSILVIDKDVKALIRVADVHYMLEKGRVVWTGTSAQLAANVDVQHRYLGV